MLIKLSPSKVHASKRHYVRTFHFVSSVPQINMCIKLSVANCLIRVDFNTQEQDCPVPYGMEAIVLTPGVNGGFVLSVAENDGLSFFFDTKITGFEISFYGRILVTADPYNATLSEVPIRYSPEMVVH